jgi:hypothetical protein
MQCTACRRRVQFQPFHVEADECWRCLGFEEDRSAWRAERVAERTYVDFGDSYGAA